MIASPPTRKDISDKTPGPKWTVFLSRSSTPCPSPPEIFQPEVKTGPMTETSFSSSAGHSAAK